MNILKNTTAQVVAGLIVLAVLAGFFVYLAKRPGTVKDTEVAAATTSDATWQGPNETAPASGEAITVGDQASGAIVTVASLTLSKPGWVAIRDEKGWTLGAGWFGAGEHAGVSVPLLRATAPGAYTAIVFFDDGDHKFQLRGEKVAVDATGKAIQATFTVK